MERTLIFLGICLGGGLAVRLARRRVPLQGAGATGVMLLALPSLASLVVPVEAWLVGVSSLIGLWLVLEDWRLGLAAGAAAGPAGGPVAGAGAGTGAGTVPAAGDRRPGEVPD